MSPLNFGNAAGSLGKCKRHGVNLLPRKRSDVAEQIATERLAQSLSARPAESLPIPTQPRARRGDCPQCIGEIAAAAVAYLNGETA